MKTNEEILKEVLSKKRTKLNKTIEELIRFEPVTSPEIRGWLYEAISSTREDCEKERKIEAHTQVSMNAYDKGFENGQKAERERILEKFGKALRKTNWDTKHSCDIFGTETLNKIEEELKKEVLKDD